MVFQNEPDVALAVAFNDCIRKHFDERGEDLISTRAVVIACLSVLTSYIEAIDHVAGKAEAVAWVHENLSAQILGARH